MKEGVLTHREVSETAASVGNKLFGPSGVQTYRVLMQTSMGGQAFADVDAATGDEAADLGLGKFPGAKVVNVSPAPEQRKKAA